MDRLEDRGQQEDSVIRQPRAVVKTKEYQKSELEGGHLEVKWCTQQDSNLRPFDSKSILNRFARL